MEVTLTKEDILGALAWLSADVKGGLAQAIATFDTCVSFSDAICIHKNLPVGSISMNLAVSALEGGIEINIKSVQLLGMNWFGTIRKKAGDMILAYLKPYAPTLKSWKNDKGNIQLQLQGVTMTAFDITTDSLFASATFPTQ